MVATVNPDLNHLKSRIDGHLDTGAAQRQIYATDASVYREIPLGVVYPKTEKDIEEILQFSRSAGISLIPRTAGTSLAGQVVGHGLVVDVSRYLTQILELDAEAQTVWVQPGVVRDELNLFLKPYGLLFGPETSTSNRAMIGGMVGNNSCGSNSPAYGTTRDHVLEIKGYLSDGSPIHIKSLTPEEYQTKLNTPTTLEGRIYTQIHNLLSIEDNRQVLASHLPPDTIKRRNMGYALDSIAKQQPFCTDGPAFNLSPLIAGSEGTLMFITAIKLSLVSLPPAHVGLMCIHFHDIIESLRGNIVALRHQPRASELIDNIILECTKANIAQSKNRFFIQGDPGAIIVVELARDSEAELDQAMVALQADLQQEELGYHYPVLKGADQSKVWNLRKAGLGLLSNIPGDAKPVAVVEDTAVDPTELPEYIAEYQQILDKHGLESVYYAHAGSGELHIRPIVNLKTEEGQMKFRAVAEDVSALVKKYKGSLSGEHGDGRLRAEFLPDQVGDRVYSWFKATKATWDPNFLLNPGKIVNAPPMDQALRYKAGQHPPDYHTVFRWERDNGILRAAELCNGSGDCRKSHLIGGTMCPSFMATREEKDTTRARANVLREVLTRGQDSTAFAAPEIKEILDLCLSCKGCKAECPSNVDMAKLKTEVYQQAYDQEGIPFRSWIFAHFDRVQQLGSAVAPLTNLATQVPVINQLTKTILGIHGKRSIPHTPARSLRAWVQKHPEHLKPEGAAKGKLLLFVDEFTNRLDVELGKKSIQLLTALGYEVETPEHEESGRAAFSKGLLRFAKEKVSANVHALAPLVSESNPLVGIEPSAILTFRDEAEDLVDPGLVAAARTLSKHALTIEEFLSREVEAGRIGPDAFHTESVEILLHGHCHQKTLSSLAPTEQLLNLPVNYSTRTLPTGCCGMAGSFGYEKEHYALSMKVGNLILFPSITAAPPSTVIAASGTSCRHQILDGTGRKAKHPVEVLYGALRHE